MNKSLAKKMNIFLKYAKIVIFVLIAIFIMPTSEAQVLTSAQVKSQVAAVFEKQYKNVVKGDVEVKISATPFAELQLPDGQITYKIASGADKIIPRDIKRVDVYVNNAYIRTLNLPAQTKIYREVLVANDFINREQALTKECTSLKRVDVSMNSDYVLDDSMLDKEITTKKAFQKGEVIDKRFVKMRPDVARNSEVRVFFVSNGAVMVTIDGTALSDGMTGDYINVENKNYKKVYNGKIIGENRVLVNI